VGCNVSNILLLQWRFFSVDNGDFYVWVGEITQYPVLVWQHPPVVQYLQRTRCWMLDCLVWNLEWLHHELHILQWQSYLEMHKKEVFPCFLNPEENYITWFEKDRQAMKGWLNIQFSWQWMRCWRSMEWLLTITPFIFVCEANQRWHCMLRSLEMLHLCMPSDQPCWHWLCSSGTNDGLAFVCCIAQ